MERTTPAADFGSGIEDSERDASADDREPITLLSIDESESDDDDEQYANDRSEWDPRFR